jgi:hypothetical protein
MNDEIFQCKMKRAQVCLKHDDHPNYWTGYIRGLSRGYNGEKFGTDAEHKLWLSLINDDTELRRERGRGYRDGLLTAAAFS